MNDGPQYLPPGVKLRDLPPGAVVRLAKNLYYARGVVLNPPEKPSPKRRLKEDPPAPRVEDPPAAPEQAAEG